jgi:hypothetical protein
MHEGEGGLLGQSTRAVTLGEHGATATEPLKFPRASRHEGSAHVSDWLPFLPAARRVARRSGRTVTG